MRPALSLLLLLAFTGALTTVAEATPRDGSTSPRWFATAGRTASDLCEVRLVKVSPDAPRPLEVVFSEALTACDFAWAGPDALVVHDRGPKTGGGRVRALSPESGSARWTATWEPEVLRAALGLEAGSALDPTLAAGPDGRAWLEVCARWETLPSGLDHCGLSWFIPAGPDGLGKPVRRAPPGLMRQRDASQQGRSPKAERVPAPPGYSAKRVLTDPGDGDRLLRPSGPVPGVRCAGPGAETATWPTADSPDWEFNAQPATITWVLQTPPLYAVEGPTLNPIGQRGRATLYFRACEPEPTRPVRLLGGGLWLEERDAARGPVWVVRHHARELGFVPGSSWQFAARPEQR